MSQKPTKSPIKPILLVKTTKVQSTKPIFQTESPPFVEIPPIPKLGQKQRQKEIITAISSSHGIESLRRPHQTLNAEQNSIKSSSSFNKISQKNSPDSLKRQIRDQSKYSYQQSLLIKKLHSDLVRAELVTGNQSSNSNMQENTSQYYNLAKRLDYLVDKYISQHEKLQIIESGALEQQLNAQINELNHQITQLKAEIENQNNQIQQLTNELHEQSDEKNLIKSYLFTLKEKTPTSITFYDLNDYTFDSVIGSGATSNVNAVYKKEKYAQKELKNLTFDLIMILLTLKMTKMLMFLLFLVLMEEVNLFPQESSHHLMHLQNQIHLHKQVDFFLLFIKHTCHESSSWTNR